MKVIVLISVFALSLFEIPATSGDCLEKMKSWKAVEVGPALLTAVPEFYYPLMSDMDLKRITADIKGKKEDEVNEAEYKDACIRVALKGDEVVFKGYGLSSPSYKLIMNGSDVVTWKRADGGNSAEGGYCKYTMTDNKTYAVILDCTFDDKFSWSVISAVPELPANTVEEIYKHVESVGGNRKKSSQVKYDSCK